MSTSTGTFISMDTYEGSIYDPDSLHKYLYANGNPVMYSDPSGNSALSIDAILAIGCMMIGITLIKCMPKLQKSTENIGIIPASSQTLANNMVLKMMAVGTINMTVIALSIDASIKGKIKGEITLYEAEQLEAVEEQDKGKNVYYVYFLKNKDDKIEYVGRTKHIKARIHAREKSANRNELELVGFARIKSYAACRAIEQAGMLGAHTLKGNNKPKENMTCNQINGVGINNGNAMIYLNTAIEILKSNSEFDDYLLNEYDNRRLNQIENYIDEGLIDYAEYYSIY